MKASDATPLEVVNDLYVEACGELLAAYGSTVHLQAQRADERDRHTTGYVSVVSATGEGIKLLSIAGIDADVLARTHLLGVEHTSERVLQDWCRELNNQLMGRVKNKLLEFGCDVRTGLPALITGTDMMIITQPDSETRRYVFASTHGGMTLTLETRLAPDFTLADGTSPAEAGVVMHAGSVLF